MPNTKKDAPVKTATAKPVKKVAKEMATKAKQPDYSNETEAERCERLHQEGVVDYAALRAEQAG